MSTPTPRLITMTEAEKLLSLDDNTIRRLIREGELTKLKIGRALRIEYQSVVDFVERHKNGQATGDGDRRRQENE